MQTRHSSATGGTLRIPPAVHLAGWTAFMAYEISTVYFSIGLTSDLLHYSSYYALNIGFFYFHARVLSLVFRKSNYPYVLAALLILPELALYDSLKSGMDSIIPSSGFNPLLRGAKLRTLLILNTFRGLYLVGLATLCWTFVRMLNLNRAVLQAENRELNAANEKVRLERNLAVSHNAYLQQQINPHLLFNTLHFIHTRTFQHSGEASQSIMLLAELMRYSLQGADQEAKTSMEAEVRQIGNLIRLSKLQRLQYIDLRTSGDFSDARIIPLVLVTLVENVLKHGQLSLAEHPAEITISLDHDHQLRYRSQNLTAATPPVNDPYGIGLKNARTRLDTWYGGNYDLIIDQQENHYILTLNIQL